VVYGAIKQRLGAVGQCFGDRHGIGEVFDGDGLAVRDL
jgi:hypothetical protein